MVVIRRVSPELADSVDIPNIKYPAGYVKSRSEIERLIFVVIIYLERYSAFVHYAEFSICLALTSNRLSPFLFYCIFPPFIAIKNDD